MRFRPCSNTRQQSLGARRCHSLTLCTARVEAFPEKSRVQRKSGQNKNSKRSNDSLSQTFMYSTFLTTTEVGKVTISQTGIKILSSGSGGRGGGEGGGLLITTFTLKEIG